MEKEPQKTEQEIAAEQELKDIICSLWTEIKKDLPFFGLSGFVVTCFFLVEDFFRQLFPNRDLGSLAYEAFSGFISLGNHGLLMAGLIIIGSIANILYCFKKEYVWLNNMIKNVECRFAQLVSTTISFAAGVVLAALLHTIFTVTSTGTILAFFTFCFMVFICMIFLSAHIITRKIGPYRDKWYASALVLVTILAAILLIQAGYQLHVSIAAVVFGCFVLAKLWHEKRHINKAP